VKRPCLVCHKPSDGPRHPECQRSGWAVRPARPAPPGDYGGGWTALSLRVRLEEPICQACGLRATEVADHIIPIQDGGARLDRSNLQGLCSSCHRRKSRLDADRRRGRQRGGPNA